MTYAELVREGEALRKRLAAGSLTKSAMTELVVDIHAWQGLSLALVEAKRPGLMESFRTATRSSRIQPGEWVPFAGWQSRLDAVLVEWMQLLAAIDTTQPFR
jgi:hypothetical protein